MPRVIRPRRHSHDAPPPPALFEQIKSEMEAEERHQILEAIAKGNCCCSTYSCLSLNRRFVPSSECTPMTKWNTAIKNSTDARRQTLPDISPPQHFDRASLSPPTASNIGIILGGEKASIKSNGDRRIIRPRRHSSDTPIPDAQFIKAMTVPYDPSLERATPSPTTIVPNSLITPRVPRGSKGSEGDKAIKSNGDRRIIRPRRHSSDTPIPNEQFLQELMETDPPHMPVAPKCRKPRGSAGDSSSPRTGRGSGNRLTRPRRHSSETPMPPKELEGILVI